MDDRTGTLSSIVNLSSEEIDELRYNYGIYEDLVSRIVKLQENFRSLSMEKGQIDTRLAALNYQMYEMITVLQKNVIVLGGLKSEIMLKEIDLPDHIKTEIAGLADKYLLVRH
ncbi:MAG: hypothetical protein M1393_03495 [Candidatus Thermoplasmatota archaeon]|nr:hypothetical protein [Candidatus Thermoplasmatota archaeon]MCL6090087.1 hypothetical protein [Candidatus Thermoplasmatota archaeon]